MYDVAIIGAGPAGISAALNLKLHNKDIIWFGSRTLSDKVQKSERIANYPGIMKVTGKDLNDQFLQQIDDMGLELTDKMVNNIMKTRKGYMIQADNDIYDAKCILLATGYASAKGFENEENLLGKGVSYCATCDGFLYPEKTLAIFSSSKRFEHEIEYLAGIASKVYVFTAYQEASIKAENAEVLKSSFKKVNGEDKVESVTLFDGTTILVDGFFVLRDAVAPTTLLRGLEMDEAHIKVNSHMETNKEGCFAAGDCTGRPYQIAVAVGEGNTAAHSILEYLASKE